LASGRSLAATTVVLALGNSQPACVGPEAARCARYVADISDAGVLDQVAADGLPVLLVGRGPTAVDATLALDVREVRTIHMLSRHALLPQPHRPAAAAVNGPDFEGLRITTAAGLVRAVRRAAGEHPGDWRDVVDALRPHTARLWAQLGTAEQQRFTARFGRFWQVHRHRMPASVAQRVGSLRQQQRLRVHRGSLLELADRGEHLDATVGSPAGHRSLRVGWVLNCTGPGWAHPIAARLQQTGLAQPDKAGPGLATDALGRIRDEFGRPQDGLLTLGPPRRGSLLESTAIPEIRAQAAQLADHIVSGSTDE
jgi:uncharacterized NAD(P)/FAD-binding protein YdhS